MSRAQVSDDAFTVTGPGGNKKFKVRYFLDDENVTAQVTGAGLEVADLGPQDTATLTLQVKVTKRAKKGNQRQTLVT